LRFAGLWKILRVSESVDIEAARIPDRDRLLGELRAAGLDARPVDEVGIEVPCGEETNAACGELMRHAEDLIMSMGAPFVPIEHEGTIYIRPPLS
jgi:hypothetical protein